MVELSQVSAEILSDMEVLKDETSLNLLKDKINELERKLSQCNQNLKTKEGIIKMQQQQMHKIEEMYKKSLEESARVHCEHKRTLHDQENLKIILKAYENKLEKNTQSQETQTNLTELEKQNDLVKNEAKIDHFIKIKGILDEQNQKTNKILELLNENNNDIGKTMRDYIEELIGVSRNLREVTERKSEELKVLSTIHMQTKKIECDELNGEKLLHNSFSSNSSSCPQCIMHQEEGTQYQTQAKEKCIQTQISNRNISQNIPKRSAENFSQVSFGTADSSSNTRKPLLITTSVNCRFTGNCVGIQNYIQTAEDLVYLRKLIRVLNDEIAKNEIILEKQNLALYQKLNEFFRQVQEKNAELESFKEKVSFISQNIEDRSLMIVGNVRQENPVCHLEFHLKKCQGDKSEASHKQLVLENQGLRNKVDELEMSLDEAQQNHVALQEEIHQLKSELESYEESLKPLGEFTELCEEIGVIASNNESQVSHSSCKKTLNDVKNLIQHLNVKSESCELLIRATKLGKSDAAINTDDIVAITIIENKNVQLVSEIVLPKYQIKNPDVNNPLADLQDICVRLSKNLSEMSILQKENAFLKEKVYELSNSQSSLNENTVSTSEKAARISNERCFYEQIENAQRDIDLIRIDNEYLAGGLDELRKVLRSLDKKNRMNRLREEDAELLIKDIKESYETESLKEKIAQLQEENVQQNAMFEELQLLSRQLNEKLIDKIAECEQLNEELPLLNREKITLEIMNENLQKLLKNAQNELEHRQNKAEFVETGINTNEFDEEDGKLLMSLQNRAENLKNKFEMIKKCVQVETLEHARKYEEVTRHTEELCQLLEQYKIVNESLLKKNQELENDKSKVYNIECGDFEEIDSLNKQNNHLRQDNNNLRLLLKDQEELIKIYELQIEELNDATKSEASEKSVQCESHLKGFQIVRKDFIKVDSENENLKTQIQKITNALSEKDKTILELSQYEKKFTELLEKTKLYRETKNCLGDEKVDKYLTELGEQNILMQQQLEKENHNLKREITKTKKELKSCLNECENYSKVLNNLRKELKVKTETIAKYEDSIEKYEGQCCKYKEEIKMLQDFINKVGGIKEKYNEICEESEELRNQLASSSKILKYNESLIDECQRLEATLKEVTKQKDKIESEYKTYAKTTDLDHEKLNNELRMLKNVLQNLQEDKDDRDQLTLELNRSKETEIAIREELSKVLNDSAHYKSQLERMSQRVEDHLKEHFEYKLKVEEAKRRFEEEIKTLRGMLGAQNAQMANDTGLWLSADDRLDKQTKNLESYIKIKELEIKRLMEHRARAMDILNHLMKGTGNFGNDIYLPPGGGRSTRHSIQDKSKDKLEKRSSSISNDLSTANAIKKKIHKDVRRKVSASVFEGTTRVGPTSRKAHSCERTTSKKKYYTSKGAVVKPM